MKKLVFTIIFCISLICCNKPKEIKHERKVPGNKSNAQKSFAYSANKQVKTDELTNTKAELISETKIENELNSFKKDLNIATGTKIIRNSEDLKIVLEKSIQFWNESDWAVFKTQFDFNNTNNMEKLENIYSKLSCTARSFNKATREKIINNLNDIAEKIYKPTMRHLINYICGDLYWRGKDYDNAILFADILYNDCLKNKDIDMASTSVTLKMKSYLKQNQPENIAPLAQQWEKDFPDSDFNNYFRINLFSVKAYFAVDVNEKVNELKGIKVLVSLLNDNRLNEKQKRKTESLYESYKDLPVCAEYLNNLTVKRR